MIKRDVVFNEVKLIFKKISNSWLSWSWVSEERLDEECWSYWSITINENEKYWSAAVKCWVESINHRFESSHWINALSINKWKRQRRFRVWWSWRRRKRCFRVRKLKSRFISICEIFLAENSITELIIEIILSNQKNEFLNSLIMIEFRKKIRHDYKKLHTKKSSRDREREFVKTAIINVFHQIATFATYEEAISSSQVVQWKQTMQTEYDNQIERETFQIVNLLYDQKAIDDKWVYKLKENLDESIIRYKVRWMIKDYRQIKDRNFDETHVFVVKANISRMMLVIVAVLNYQIRQFDIKTIFLYEQMNRMIYTDQSKNFEIDDSNKTCLLNTDLYELM